MEHEKFRVGVPNPKPSGRFLLTEFFELAPSKITDLMKIYHLNYSLKSK